MNTKDNLWSFITGF